MEDKILNLLSDLLKSRYPSKFIDNYKPEYSLRILNFCKIFRDMNDIHPLYSIGISEKVLYDRFSGNNHNIAVEICYNFINSDRDFIYVEYYIENKRFIDRNLTANNIKNFWMNCYEL